MIDKAKQIEENFGSNDPLFKKKKHIFCKEICPPDAFPFICTS